MENKNTVFSCVCEKCGRTLYEGEMLNIKGRFVCEPCAERYVFNSGGSFGKRSVPSPFFHFIFSLHPGAGQMYLGLMKRGLFQMCLFYLCIYLTSMSMPGFFGVVIAIIYFYSFFDSLTLRRRMAAGEIVTDNIDGAVSFLNRNRALVVIAIIIMAISCIFTAAAGLFVSQSASVRHPQSVEYYFDVPAAPNARNPEFVDGQRPYGVSRGVERTIERIYYERPNTFKKYMPLIIIGLGGLIVLKSAKKGGKKADAPPAGDSGDDYLN